MEKLKVRVEEDQSNDKLSKEMKSGAGILAGDSNESQLTLKSFSWGFLAKAIAAIAAGGGLALHLMGYVGHQTYLSTWGIDPGLFPMSTDAIIIEGFYALIDRTATIFSAMTHKVSAFVTAGLIVVLYLFVILYVNRIAKDRSGKIFGFSIRLPEIFIDLLKSFLIAVIALGGVPVALVFSVLILAVPAVLGESFGSSSAEQQMSQYRAGCNQREMKERCVELRGKQGRLAYGFVLDSSESHIAIFDTDKNQVVSLEREGTELLVDEPLRGVNSGASRLEKR